MKVLDVLGVRVEMPTNQPIVLLRERDGDRYLPIWIGAAEATAIAYAQQGVVPPRPLTHDLLRNVIDELGHELTQVRIVALKDGVFHAMLDLDGERRGGTTSSPGPPTPSPWPCGPGRDRRRRGLLDEAGVEMSPRPRTTRSRSSRSSSTTSRPTTSTPEATGRSRRGDTRSPGSRVCTAVCRDTPVSVGTSAVVDAGHTRPYGHTRTRDRNE